MNKFEFTETGRSVYERTYSRTKADGSKETWPETVHRVATGNLNLTPWLWGDSNRHEYLEELHQLEELMTNFAILPAGRHLWSSGVRRRQHLFNCWTSGWTADKLQDHFTFSLLRLMEGGGVGSNYASEYLEKYGHVKNKLKVHIVCRPDHPDYQRMKDAGLLSDTFSPDWDWPFVVEDTREGWADALADLLDAYMREDTAHTDRVFDVSNIRPEGAPLKTSGGVASGPAPLAEMLIEISKIMNRRHGEPLTPLDAMEIDHQVARAAVAGGNRRSARMAMLPWNDPHIFDFIACKADGISHWTTNISVIIDDDFIDAVNDRASKDNQHALAVLRKVAEGMRTNGEPGLWHKTLSQEGEVGEVISTNPCFHPDTIVETADGPKRIADITEPTMVYTKGPSGGIELRKASASFITKRNAETLRIGLSNGDELIVTPEHKVMLRDGTYVMAKDLKAGDSLEAICRARRGWRYSGVKLSSQPNRAYRMEHRIVYEGVHGAIPDGYDIDHINRDHHDNRIDNLRLLPHSEHARLSREQVPNDHQVKGEGGKFVPSGKHGRKSIEGAIKPPRSTNWPNQPRVTYVEPGPVTDVYDITVDETHNLIANGVVVHNCGEIALEPFEPCNLGHLNLAAFVRDGEFIYSKAEKAARGMTRFLLRATFGDVNDPKSREILDRNRRIGVGLFGFQEALALMGIRYSEAPDHWEVRTILRFLKKVIRDEARWYAFTLRIPEPVKVTTVAPTGTIAKMPGTTEGIHPIFSRYYIRRIRFSTIKPEEVAQLEKYKRLGYNLVPDPQAANTMVVEIPTKEAVVERVEQAGWPGEIVESVDELSLDQLLAVQAMVQEEYADNAVSFTANLDPAKYTEESLCQTLIDFLPSLKGTTIFPEKGFELAPYERLTREEYEDWVARTGLGHVEDGVDEECVNGCPIR